MSETQFTNPALVLLEIPGTGADRLRAAFGAPSATRRVSALGTTSAPRIAVICHPYIRFQTIVRSFAEGRDGQPPRIAGIPLEEAIDLLEKPQVPFDLSRDYPQAELKHALMPMTHPVHSLHRAHHVLRREKMAEDWTALSHSIALPELPDLDKMDAVSGIPATLEPRLRTLYATDFELLGYTPQDTAPVAASRLPSPPELPSVWDLWPTFFESRSIAKDHAPNALPDPDVPLVPFLQTRVAGRRGRTWTGREEDLIQHFKKLQPEFADASRLAHLLAATIVVLRRAPDCAEALQLFQRILSDHSAAIAPQLKLRWLASVCDTLADHGVDQGQRALGLAGSLLANTLKLSESERRIYGPNRPWPPKVRWSSGGPLFDGMITYWVEKGEMIAHMRDRLQRVASQDPSVGPIVVEVMERAHRNNTVYRRFAAMAGHPSPPLMDPALRAELKALLADAL
ncbi:MAG: hypothetical protein AAGA38_11285 [Pseudomonadota bacterium]